MSSHAIYVHGGDTDDELDLIDAHTPNGKQKRAVHKSISAPVRKLDHNIEPLRRSARPRASVATAVIPAKKEKKRKRSSSASTSTVENYQTPPREKKRKVVEKDMKKMAAAERMDEKKSLTIVLNSRRVQIDNARRRWLHAHRNLFLPLLPASSSYFDNLSEELRGEPAEIVPFHELEEQPKLIEGGTMKDYQLHGLSFLVWMYKNGMNCILGDEMGLGKTLQTLSLLAYIKQHHTKGTLDPHLIICPLSVLSSWLAELARWVPSISALRFHGSAAERERLKRAMRGGELTCEVLVTTYDAFAAEDAWFKARRWTFCVLDEGHRIKNADTALAHRVQGLGALHRLILTGTPVHNNLTELWGLLHWLYPSVFSPASQRAFGDAFDLTRGQYALPFLAAAQRLLAAIMLRRTKATIELSVPPREETTVFVPLTEAQRFWTYRLLTRLDEVDLEQIFVKGEAGEKEGKGAGGEGRRQVMEHLRREVTKPMTAAGEQNQWKRLMNLLMQLRKVCDHPYMLPDAEPSPYAIGEHLVASSSKLIVIDKILDDVLPKGERVLIFSQWTSMLDLVEDFMALRSIPYARLDGSTSRPRRALDIKLFQQDVSPYKVFLISTKAGGLGINLTKASTVIMCDSDWNPQNDLQAIARAHRIGQTKVCKVYRLICRGSVEDQMLDRIRRKLFLSVKVMGSDNPSSTESTQLGSSELMDILKKGSSALTSTDDEMPLASFLDAPFADILAVSRERENVRQAKLHRDLEPEAVMEDSHGADEERKARLLQDAEEEERRLLSGAAQVHSRLFEGRVVQQATTKSKDNKEIASEWKELQKRARDNRIVVVDGMEFVAAHVGPQLVVAPESSKPKKRQGKKFESEDWCVYCRDGGEVVLCTRCPRVFHASCHGVTKVFVKRNTFIVCPQHDCTSCQRSTADSGGMLFRCQTCPQAFCEDCLPDGDLDAVGDTLPEFELLGYGATSTAYYIRCHDCRMRFADDPESWAVWQQDVRETQKKLEERELL